MGNNLNYEFFVRDAQKTMDNHAAKMRKVYKMYGENCELKIALKLELSRDYIREELNRSRIIYGLQWAIDRFKEEKNQRSLNNLKTNVNFLTRQVLERAIKEHGIPPSYSTAVYMTIYKHVNHEMKQAMKGFISRGY